MLRSAFTRPRNAVTLEEVVLFCFLSTQSGTILLINPS
jgi:hypothetical protein